MMMFSIASFQIFFTNFVIYTTTKQKTAYRFIIHTTKRNLPFAFGVLTSVAESWAQQTQRGEHKILIGCCFHSDLWKKETGPKCITPLEKRDHICMHGSSNKQVHWCMNGSLKKGAIEHALSLINTATLLHTEQRTPLNAWPSYKPLSPRPPTNPSHPSLIPPPSPQK